MSPARLLRALCQKVQDIVQQARAFGVKASMLSPSRRFQLPAKWHQRVRRWKPKSCEHRSLQTAVPDMVSVAGPLIFGGVWGRGGEREGRTGKHRAADLTPTEKEVALTLGSFQKEAGQKMPRTTQESEAADSGAIVFGNGPLRTLNACPILAT